MKSEASGPVANRGALTLSIMLANIMPGLDTTIANPALSHIRGSLSASLDQISLILTSYIVAAAIKWPPTGWLAGRLGIKHIFLLSVGGFMLASALSDSATNLTELVIYRGLQGIFGAGSSRCRKPSCYRSTHRCNMATQWPYSASGPY